MESNVIQFTVARFCQITNLLNRREQRQFGLLVLINTIAAFVEVLGVFSILPFLAVAGNAKLIDEQPILHWAYNLGNFNNHTDFVIYAGIFTATALLLTNSIGILSLWYRTNFCYSVVAAMSDRLFRGYLAQPYSFYMKRNTNVLSKDLLNETYGFFTNVLDPVTSIIARGLQLIFITAALLIYNWRAAIFVGILFGGFYVIVYFLFQKRLQLIGSIRWKCNELRHRVVGEALGGMKEVRLFGRESWYADIFRLESHRYGSLQGRGFLYAVVPRYLIETLAFSSLVLFVIVSLWQGKVLTDILPILGVFAVAGIRLMPAIQIVFQYASGLRTNWITVDRLEKLFTEADALAREPELPQNSTEVLDLNDNLILRDIVFAYGTGIRPVIQGVSLTIPARACVGFCGTSGAGKTTLMDICLGLLEPQSGAVFIDDCKLTSSNRRAWQRNVGYVPQQIYLLDGSISQNIAFGLEGDQIDQNAIVKAAKLASLHDFILDLPNGYSTCVGERGIRLSGGQRQRIAIARALYHDPEVLFFDEATSALDSETENMIVDSIQALAHQKTIIIVAHRLTTLRYCDKIYTLEAGVLIKESNYKQLLEG